MKSEKFIKDYIHHLFGKDIKVSFKRHFRNGCVGYANPKTNSICLVYRIRQHWEEYQGVIWHELGHLKTMKDSPKVSIRGEVEAHLWAINEAKKRGYAKIYELLIDMVYNWTQLQKGDGYRWLTYRIAGQRILKQLEI